MKMLKRIALFLQGVLLVLGIAPCALAADDDALFYERPQEKTDYAYSFAVVGDIQTHVMTDAKTLGDANLQNDTSHTYNLYKWIVDNKEEKNIQWVFGLGDLTENENYTVPGSDEQEWQIAKSAIRQLDRAGVRYSLIPGNHDNLKSFDAHFNSNFYTSRVTGYYDERTIANHYINFEVAGTKYMVLCLEFGPKDEILDWANKVVEAHPGRRVIVTTHSYLDKDGSLADKDSVCPPPSGNNGDVIWDKFVSKHRNIIMVLSGHLTNRNVGFSQRTGVHGNTVSQFLIDPQDANYVEGFICMLYFSADGKKASVEWISTARTQAAQRQNPDVQDILYNKSNQFAFDVTNLTYTGDDPEQPISVITTYRPEKTSRTTTTTTTKGKTTSRTVSASTSSAADASSTPTESSTITGPTVTTAVSESVNEGAMVAPRGRFPTRLVIGGAVAALVIGVVVWLCLAKK